MSKFKLAVGVILLVVVGILIGSLGTGLLIKQRAERYALGGPGPPDQTAFIFGRLAQRLDLSDGQRKEIKQLFDDYGEEMLDIRSQYLPAIEEATEKTFSQLREELDSQQLERLDRLQQRIDHLHKRRHMRRERGGFGPRGDFEPERFFSMLDERLALQPEQAEQVRSLFEETMKMRRGLFARPGDPVVADRDQVRKEMDKLDKQMEERLSEILSEEQMAVYKSLPRMRPHGKHRMKRPPERERNPSQAF